jgi:predicted AlkP superfamily phosphohydrolase/phosphomutase
MTAKVRRCAWMYMFFSLMLLLFLSGCGGERTPVKKDQKNRQAEAIEGKIFLIGLDGADWGVIDRLLKGGKLPNLKRLIHSGVSGRLRTLRPWRSPLIWTSIVTGKKPQKHGIHGFLNQRGNKEHDIPYCRLNRRCLALWNILSQQGMVVGIVGPWVTWPAEKVNGYILSDRMYAKNLTATTFPPELKDILFQQIDPLSKRVENPLYTAMQKMLEPGNLYLRSALQKNIKNEKTYLQQDHLKASAGLYFNDIFDPNFFFLYIRGPDVTGHFFWKYYEPDPSVSPDEIEAFADLIPYNYMYQDYIVGEYLREAGPDTTTIIVSDHGMARSSYPPKIYFTKIHHLWKALGIEDRVSHTEIKVNAVEVSFSPEVNLKEMQNLLSKVKLGNQRRPLFQISAPKGKNSLSLDIEEPLRRDTNLFIYFEGRRLARLSQYALNKEVSGDHTLHGILIMEGKHIKKNYRLKKCSVLDITPTILYLLGLPVGRDMDGRVLKEAFDSRFLQTHPIHYVETHEPDKEDKHPATKQYKRDPLLDQKLLDQLKTLGYIN